MKKTIAILLVAILAVGMVFADATLSGKFTSKLAYDLNENRLAFSEPDNKINLNFALSTASENEGDIYAVVKGELVLSFTNDDGGKEKSSDVTSFDSLLISDDSKFAITEASIYGNGWHLSVLNAAEMPKYASGWETYNDGDNTVDLIAPVSYKDDLGVTFAMDGIFQAGFSVDADFDEDAAKNILVWAATNDLTFADVTANAAIGFKKDADAGLGYLGIGAGVEYASDTISASVGSDMNIGIPTEENVDSTFDMDVSANVNYADMVTVAAYYATAAKVGTITPAFTENTLDIVVLDDYAMGMDKNGYLSSVGRGFYTATTTKESSFEDGKEVAMEIENYLSLKTGVDLNAFDVPVALTIVGMDLINNPYFDVEAKATFAGFEIPGFGGYQAILKDKINDEGKKDGKELGASVFHVGGEVAYTIDPVGKLFAGMTYVGYLANVDGAEIDNALSAKVGLENTTLVSGATLKVGYETDNLLDPVDANGLFALDKGEIYVSATFEF